MRPVEIKINDVTSTTYLGRTVCPDSQEKCPADTDTPLGVVSVCPGRWNCVSARDACWRSGAKGGDQ